MKRTANASVRELYSQATGKTVDFLKILAGDYKPGDERYWRLDSRFELARNYLRMIDVNSLNTCDRKALGKALGLIYNNESWIEKRSRNKRINEDLNKLENMINEYARIPIHKINRNDYANSRFRREAGQVSREMLGIRKPLLYMFVTGAMAIASLSWLSDYRRESIGRNLVQRPMAGPIESGKKNGKVTEKPHVPGKKESEMRIGRIIGVRPIKSADTGEELKPVEKKFEKAEYDMTTREGRQAARADGIKPKEEKGLFSRIKGYFSRKPEEKKETREEAKRWGQLENYVRDELNLSYVKGENSFERAFEHLKDVGRDTFGEGGSFKDVNGEVVENGRGSYLETLTSMGSGLSTFVSGKNETGKVGIGSRLKGLYNGTLGGIIKAAGNTTQAGEDLVDAVSEATLGTASEKLPGKVGSINIRIGNVNNTVKVIVSTAQNAAFGEGWHRVHETSLDLDYGWDKPAEKLKGLPVVYNLFSAPTEEAVNVVSKDGKAKKVVKVRNTQLRRWIETLLAIGVDYWVIENLFGGNGDDGVFNGEGIFDGGNGGGGNSITIGDLS